MQTATPMMARALRAALEPLESRTLLSVSIVDAGSTLYITGDANANRVALFEGGSDSAGHTLVEVQGQTSRFFDKIFDTIKIDLDSGCDVLRIVITDDLGGVFQTSGFAPLVNGGGVDQNICVDLGNDNDRFLFTGGLLDGIDTVGAAAPSNFIGGSDIVGSHLSLDVSGGNGMDQLNFDMQNISVLNSTVDINARGGNGEDALRLRLPAFAEHEAIVSSDLSVCFDLGNGDDRTQVDAFTDIRDGSSVGVDILGQNGDDAVHTDMAAGVFGTPASSLQVDADLGRGDDRFVADLDFSGDGFLIDQGDLASFDVLGGSGDDVIRYNLNDPSPGGSSIPIAGSLEFLANGGSGNDTISANGGDHTLLDVTSTGELTVNLDAAGGNDRALINLATSQTSDGLYDLQLLGGAGNDVLAMRFQNNGINSDANYPGVSPLLDGGDGFDIWDVDGNVNLVDIAILNVELENDALLPGG